MDMFNAMTNEQMFAVILLLIGLLVPNLEISGAESVGVCYGRMSNNLPLAKDVVYLYRTNGIKRMRIYDPDQATLEALRGTDIELILGVPNSDLQSLATDTLAANQWVHTYVANYSTNVNFKYIAVGNEVDPKTNTAQFAPHVLPAMQNILNELRAIGLQEQIKVSTATYLGLLGNSYPPSQGAFHNDVRQFIDPIIKFIVDNDYPLLVNVYPYFSYIGNPKDISLDYALFTANGTVISDGPLDYQNLFEATVDAYYSALEKAGGASTVIVVSESGWPSDGGLAATLENAGTYYELLINQVKNVGTPKKPGKAIETYLFAMFDENLKPGAETEKHFGLFYPSQLRKYNLTFG